MKKILIGLGLIIGQMAWAVPARVVLIRHAEKISDAELDLSPRGFERADALPKFIEDKFGFPIAIFPMMPKQEDGADVSSRRSVQTVLPLANDLQARAIPFYFRAEYTRNKTEKMVKEIKSNPNYDGKLVLICWQHEKLSEIARELGVKKVKDWNSSVFDRAWVIDFSPKGKVTDFQDVAQNLLSGDSKD